MFPYYTRELMSVFCYTIHYSMNIILCYTKHGFFSQESFFSCEPSLRPIPKIIKSGLNNITYSGLLVELFIVQTKPIVDYLLSCSLYKQHL